MKRFALLFALLFAFLILGSSALAPTVSLGWDQSISPEVTYQNLYYSTSPVNPATGRFDTPITITLEASAVEATVSNLENGTFYFAVTALVDASIESVYSNVVVVTFNATPTPAPTATPAGIITVSPITIAFVGEVNGPPPDPQNIRVTTSTGAAWTSFDTSPWFNTSPTNHGASGEVCVLTPHIESLAPGAYSENITFSSPELPDEVVVVTMIIKPKAPTNLRIP